jgi:hypothetical protein
VTVIQDIPVKRIRWKAARRIVPTRHPTIYLFDRVAAPEDFDALYALEAMTNDRARDETGEIELVAREDRIFGPGSGPIMASFTHLNPLGSRFSNGSFGVFYAAGDKATAIEETRFHHAIFLAATDQGPLHLPMRMYSVQIDGQLHDVRNNPAYAALHAPDSYAASQAAGVALRNAGSAGIAYDSVRRSGGQCVGLFRPQAARECVHAAHLLYAWDGQAFSGIYEHLA